MQRRRYGHDRYEYELYLAVENIDHSRTKTKIPQTNGSVERFNGRVQREVLGNTISSYRDLERLLAGSKGAYNASQQRASNGRSPE